MPARFIASSASRAAVVAAITTACEVTNAPPAVVGEFTVYTGIMNPDVESLNAQQIIEAFGLERHHAAGWFAPHYGDSDGRTRPRLSSIYHLITGDEPLPLHKVDGVEVWHHYIGAPAEISVVNGIGVRETSVLGRDIFGGQRPQLAVPAHLWQSCRSLGDWTLLGCTMSPGYSTRAVFMLDADR